jgi:hypothetical protein
MRSLLKRWIWVWALCSLAPAIASAENLPLSQTSGGTSFSTSLVDQMRRQKAAAKARRKGGDLEQVLVLPQRPGKNNVRFYEFDWRRYDYLDEGGLGGVRLYFYEREKNVARVAAALVRDQYELLSEKFRFRPLSRIPYILYNSHREFENTNVFFVNEYILGVTSPQDLRMALPYWGEIERFREVSTHEMVHQFQIQKMAERAAAAGVDTAINKFPLWFTEGLAEYYSKNGVDRETDMFARDILINPRPREGYALPSFWADSQASFIYTYKMGQLRVAFLADQYGERIIQALIDQSPKLSASGRAFDSGDGPDPFQVLVSRLVGERPDAIAQRWSSWMKRRYLPEYLDAMQEPPAIPPLEIEGEPDAFVAAMDGNAITYRTVERDSGRSHLYLADRRDKESARRIASDGIPGYESLYPVLRRVMAVTTNQVAFFARNGPADTLYVRPFERKEKGREVRIELGDERKYDLAKVGLIEAGDPAFSPSGDRIAFFGLDELGSVDIWTVRLADGELKRITNNPYAERDLTWTSESPADFGVAIGPGGGQDGTIIFATDETETRRYNLSALDPSTGATVRLTDEPADHRSPQALGDGQVVFATDANGKMDLHTYNAKTKRLKRITDFVTSLSFPSIGPKGFMALGFFGGQYRIFEVSSGNLLNLDDRPALAGEIGPTAPLPSEAIPDHVPRYDPFSAGSWRLENGVAAVGSYSFGQGALLFGDTLSDRNVLVQFAMFGSPSLTDALALYLDRSKRQQLGVGLFHTFSQRRDISPPGFSQNDPGTDVFYLQREYGVTGLWSYPFSTFTRLETRLVAQGVHRGFLYPVLSNNFITARINTADLRTWDDQRGGGDFESVLTFRFGYDTTRYRYPVGAYGGGSLVAELGGGTLPFHQPTAQFYGYGLTDAQYHIRAWILGVLHLRFAAGYSGGSVFGRQFYLSSFDNLRMYRVNDYRQLIGTTYAVANANFEVPLDAIIRIALFSNVKAVLGADFGSVAPATNRLWDSRALAGVVGVNLGLGPFELRLHFAKAIDTGNNNNGVSEDWVTNLSLSYVYF